MPPAKGRYQLTGADLSGTQYPIDSSDDLEEMLHRRDLLMDARPSQRKSFSAQVHDREDEERGYSDWCLDCPIGRWNGTFGNRPCDECAVSS